MRIKLFTAIAFCAMAMISCDEDTGTVGASLTNENDKLDVTTHVFNVFTNSKAVEAVYSKERQCYVGRVLDPETGAIVKNEFTTQFNMMEHAIDDLPSKESVICDDDGEIMADSCVIRIFFDVPSSYGDTLTTMKLRISELDRPISGESSRYTNFNAKTAGYIRQDGIQKDLVFSMRDLTRPDSTRYKVDSNLHRNSQTSDNGYYDMIDILLNDEYTAKDGTKYLNYGTYILRTFYEHPEYFINSYAFSSKVCPGFHFETVDGLGVMARIKTIDMYVFYRSVVSGRVARNYLLTTSTEEVVQTSTVINDTDIINMLVEDNSCTYIKSPAGIFTEVEFPVDEIYTAHPTDTLLSAKVAFQRINNYNNYPDLSFSVPSKLLLIEKDSIDSFFTGNKSYNNTYAYQSTLSSNAYTYSNISNLISRMYNSKVKGLKEDSQWVTKHPNWNKAMLIPIDEITVTGSSYGSTTSTTIALTNKMGLSSTRLVKGSETQPIEIEVVYAKFRAN